MTSFKESLYFGRCLMTIFNGNAFFEGTLRGRFREKTKVEPLLQDEAVRTKMQTYVQTSTES